MRTTYSGLQKGLHWIIALLVIGMIPAGFIFTDFDNKAAIEGVFGVGSFNVFYNMHKSTGFLILFLMLLRVVVKLVSRKPEYEVPLTGPEKAASGAVHGLFYVLLIALPVLGWAGVSAYSAPLPVYGLFDMPPLVAKDRDLSETLFEFHGLIAVIVAGLVFAHIGAALYHQFVKKDGLIRRMTG
ncbi:MAG: cytochrome b [Pseudomonadota bacterium]